MSFPGGLLIGDDAGTLNFAKIKGSHTAMKSGMIAAETVAEALAADQANTDLEKFADNYRNSWAWKELHMQRNFGPAQHKFGNILGSAYAFIDINLFNGRCPGPCPTRLQIINTKSRPASAPKLSTPGMTVY